MKLRIRDVSKREQAVSSIRLLAGRTLVHVYSDEAPGAGFEPVEPGFKDVYFSVMAGHRGRRARQTEWEVAT